MTTTAVKAKIRTAMADSFITRDEADGIVKQAEKGYVSAGEAKAVADLFDRGTRSRPVPPGMMVTLAIPENPGDVILEQGAKSVMEAFFAKHNIPAGPQKAQLKERISSLLDNTDLGKPLAKAPNEKSLFALPLTDPLDVARDLPMQTALLNLRKDEFFVKVEGGFVADPTPKVYGPFKIPEASGKLSQARIDEIRGKFIQADRAGLLNYQRGGVIQAHLGVQFERVELMRERHPDGYAYTAYVPVGAVVPNGQRVDPNTVNQVFVERTGGLAGLTDHVMINL